MRIEQIMSKCFGFSPQTYFNWKKEEARRPIITLISKYLSKKEILEFLDTGKIAKLDMLTGLDLTKEDIEFILRNKKILTAIIEQHLNKLK